MPLSISRKVVWDIHYEYLNCIVVGLSCCNSKLYRMIRYEGDNSRYFDSGYGLPEHM